MAEDTAVYYCARRNKVTQEAHVRYNLNVFLRTIMTISVYTNTVGQSNKHEYVLFFILLQPCEVIEKLFSLNV